MAFQFAIAPPNCSGAMLRCSDSFRIFRSACRGPGAHCSPAQSRRPPITAHAGGKGRQPTNVTSDVYRTGPRVDFSGEPVSYFQVLQDLPGSGVIYLNRRIAAGVAGNLGP